jgi:hypothetical protein
MMFLQQWLKVRHCSMNHWVDRFVGFQNPLVYSSLIKGCVLMMVNQMNNLDVKGNVFRVY